jgi:hypothetical protein
MSVQLQNGAGLITKEVRKQFGSRKEAEKRE